MQYLGTQNHDHGETPRIGVLLVNLGTPDAPTRSALRRYLREFLSDPRVVEVPRLLWWCILNGVILNVRPSRSARAYRTVWTEAGSPLLVHTRDQARALQEALHKTHGERVVVDFAMRYGNPSIPSGLDALWRRGARQLLVLPLYPQYSGPTTASTFDAVAANFRHRRWLPELRFLNQYHDHPAYIGALADSVRAHWADHGRADQLLFSYHGEPQRYLDQGDPYHCQCLKTSRLVAGELGLSEGEYQSAFQSRFGREPWLQPYTDETLKGLPASGNRSVQVICPGFAADCLETLEEIAVENREVFLAAGGERFDYIPCLNAGRGHIEALRQIVDGQIADWLARPAPREGTRERARAMGAPN
ncbi:ferrochelatase [Parahaliea mediterranea]|uniref:Ferrochelatase n=1 Tax=Parahaliea mediterranea TaxID=651086 RepID=A0A939IIA7_9GAMM|nr:ferrochelatase [Parahaliea mediterranea]MBN7795046.1 ferrochelatase [Parahaliea mediterranea]